tara:strand:+ start:9 stop:329 length:321 start_codon:yes stop_codon:yes gene_type:complete
MTNQVIKLKGFQLQEHICLTGDHHRVLYFCKWDGDIIEIHNPQTLKKKYLKSGLFDENDQHIFESNALLNIKIPFYKYFQQTSNYNDNELVDIMFQLENMMIMRIK